MPELATPQLDQLKQAIPDPAKDLRINLGNALNSEVLDATQTWGVALASAYFIGEPRLRDALVGDARAAGVSEDVFQDAQAAAALMGMNTIFYRFRHMVGKDSYAKRPARLRMQWMTQPKTGKANYELYSLAVAALEGCEVCVKAHEAAVLKSGLTEEHIQDAVRIAAVLNGAAVALRL